MAWYLSLEGGGTRSSAGFYEDDRLVAEATAGPSNPLAGGTASAAAVIVELAQKLVPPGIKEYTLLAGIAGVVSKDIATDIARQLAGLPGLGTRVITTDLHPLLFSHVPSSPGILAIAGTGSSVLYHDGQQHFRRFGGRGPLMGDAGSAYQIAVSALRAVAMAQDDRNKPTTLTEMLHPVLGLPDVDSLVPWSLGATKREIAALAPTVLAAAEAGDPIAAASIENEASQLADIVGLAAAVDESGHEMPLYLQGGVFDHGDRFRTTFLAALAIVAPRLRVEALRQRSHQAVLALRHANYGDWCHVIAQGPSLLSSTEGQCDTIPPIDTLTTAAFVDRMIQHESQVGMALRQQASKLTALTEAAAQVLRQGGRMIYMGAGTSGRLGVLDASECPPTFGTDPSQVIGLIAGGEAALRTGVEGAEDDREQGIADLKAVAPNPSDIVIGIAASGTTPYVLAALTWARQQGSATALLCCNPRTPATDVDYLVALPTGAEALPGSTRLNAGTATKIALNIVSTGAMAQSGYVYAGHMVKMRPSNIKLRARAVRMVVTLTGADAPRCEQLLEAANYQIPIALIMHRHHVDAATALQRYTDARGCLRELLEDIASS